MKVFNLTERSLSPKADELVRFDMDSIRQVIAAQHAVQPEFWLPIPTSTNAMDAFFETVRVRV